MPEFRVSPLELYDKQGRRKYLNTSERVCFYKQIQSLENTDYLFCALLYWTGARFSEVLNLTVRQIDMCESKIVIESLKKRRKGIFRCVPVPERFVGELASYMKNKASSGKLFSSS